MVTIHVSDIHLGSNACDIEPFGHFVDSLLTAPPARFVINGDLADGVPSVLGNDEWVVLRKLRSLAARCELVYTRGNHDGTATELAAYLGVPLVDDYTYDSILCIHGHQWDRYLTDYPTVTLLANDANGLIATRWPGAAAELKRWRKLFYRVDDAVQAGAIALAAERGAGAVLCGHTHWSRQSGPYTNTGSWADDTPTYAVEENGKVTLERYL